MKAFCPGCGVALIPGSLSCRACKTPVRGARFDDHVLVVAGQELQVPPVCCCCLQPRQTVQQHNMLAEKKKKGKTRYFVTVQVPWCRACLKRRSKFWLAVGGWSFAGLMLGTASADLLGGGAAVVILGALAGAAAGGATAFKLVPKLSKAMRLAGHVAFCDAFRGASPVGHKVTGRRAVTARFGNRAFAKQWVELNGGGV